VIYVSGSREQLICTFRVGQSDGRSRAMRFAFKRRAHDSVVPRSRTLFTGACAAFPAGSRVDDVSVRGLDASARKFTRATRTALMLARPPYLTALRGLGAQL
jgi:hypothetical protein